MVYKSITCECGSQVILILTNILKLALIIQSNEQ